MIPVSLRLRNFMCYREGVPTLEFGDIHVACISGPNGAGKSALLDAMTWALWGRARSRSDDALITSGAQEMEVEFEFLLEGNHYRVFRRRDRAAGKGAGKTQLDLQVFGALGWRSMAGETIRQTELRITELLRMDYDTFINSAFLLQGRADEFTVKPPADRKRILADILGLSYYDVLEQRARERLRAEERNVQALGLLLEDLQARMAGREAYEQALSQAQAQTSALEEETARSQLALSELQASLSELEATARQAAEVRRRVAQLGEEAGRLEEQAGQQRARLASARALIERSADIDAGYARLVALRERHEALGQAAGRRLALTERQSALEQAIERARSAQVTEREVLRRSIAEATTRLRERPAIEARVEQLQEDLARLREAESLRDRLRDEAQELVAGEHTLRAEMQRLHDEMAGLREKITMLQEGTTECPLCHSPLDAAAFQHIHDSYQRDGEERRRLYRSREGQVEELDGRLAGLRTELDTVEQELKRTRPLEGQFAALQKELGALDRLAEEQAVKSQRLEECERVLADGAYAAAEQAALTALEADMAALRYDQEEHQAVQRELAQLKAVEEEHRQLHAVRERLAEEEQRHEETRAALRRSREEARAEQERLDGLEAGLVELPTLQRRRQEAEQVLQTAQSALGQARLALGAAQRELERLQEVEQSYREKKRAHQEAAERRSIYDELSAALGKRGVQAMLIETAVPEIEREANELLARMTDGEMSLQLAMQRSTKQGSVVETLDINISDAQGTRAYEMYSGGQAFRINFALRIALSRLLARRAGASLQTLVIDEGFGTQDTAGQDRLVEAIRSIQDEFEKILVITHIVELKESFPVRIEIERTAEGSRWTVM